MMAKRARTDNSVVVRIHPKEDSSDLESLYPDDDDDLGEPYESEYIRSFSGEIMVNGKKGGSFSAYLVDREAAGVDFLADPGKDRAVEGPRELVREKPGPLFWFVDLVTVPAQGQGV